MLTRIVHTLETPTTLTVWVSGPVLPDMMSLKGDPHQ